eukprot:GHVU01181069.1.p1 GENE.GHVU01181069.1~~GHVU01181069.1.p1  ORF type:complete len:173 (+),score=14.61 GHVU01181069.1:78-521(+)
MREKLQNCVRFLSQLRDAQALSTIDSTGTGGAPTPLTAQQSKTIATRQMLEQLHQEAVRHLNHQARIDSAYTQTGGAPTPMTAEQSEMSSHEGGGSPAEVQTSKVSSSDSDEESGSHKLKQKPDTQNSPIDLENYFGKPILLDGECE